MRISDWSSDVCYSDLDQHLALAEKLRLQLVDRAVQRLVLARLLVGRGLRIVGIVENGLARHVGHGFNPLYLWTWWSDRSEEHTSELQSLMRISYAVFCLKKKKQHKLTKTKSHIKAHNN